MIKFPRKFKKKSIESHKKTLYYTTHNINNPLVFNLWKFATAPSISKNSAKTWPPNGKLSKTASHSHSRRPSVPYIHPCLFGVAFWRLSSLENRYIRLFRSRAGEDASPRFSGNGITWKLPQNKPPCAAQRLSRHRSGWEFYGNLYF